ncbi:hypothetical protein ACWDTQ_32600 [Streptomyces cellulosae]
MPSYDDDYLDLLTDQLGARATVHPDLTGALEQRPLTEAPLELDRSVSTAHWKAQGAAPPAP